MCPLNIPDKLSSSVFAVFVRYPQPGKIKARLSAACGADIAARMYAICAENIFRELKKIEPRSDIVLFYGDESRYEEIRAWAGPDFFYLPQQGNDQAERVKTAFSRIFSAGAEKVCLLCKDVPDLSCPLIEEAAEALKTCDIVLGPSTDGGYYILGMSGFYPGILTDMEWSAGALAARTIERIYEQKLTLALLPRLIDIETKEDLLLWLEKLPHCHNHPLEEFIYRIGFIKGDQI